MIGFGVLILVVVIAGVAAYVRLAPHDVSRWHQLTYPAGPGDSALAGGFVHRRAVPEDTADALLARLDGIIRATPRTDALAGSVGERMITYVTRSQLWGFPDYTTVAIRSDSISGTDPALLEIHGRLRFGKSDLGVNRTRIKGWLAELDEGT